MKWILSFLVLILFVGCVTIEPTKMSNEEMQFLQIAVKSPKTFEVHKDTVEDVWSRGIEFITKYSDMKIQTVSDHYIDTYNPPPRTNMYDSRVVYAYKIIRVKKGDVYTITVDGSSNFALGTWLNENLHLLSYYMRFGNMPYESVIDYNNKLRDRENVRKNYQDFKK